MKDLRNLTVNDPTPWYRQLWPWLLIVPPLGAVLGGIATLVLAITSDDGLVNADYYKDGLGINRVLEKDLAAQALGLVANARFNVEGGRVQVLLDAELAQPPTLQLQLLHPTRDRLDQMLELRSLDGVSYAGEFAPLPPGLWYLRLSPVDGAWRLNGRLRLPGEVTARLAPSQL